jgi:hypothetical protein
MEDEFAGRICSLCGEPIPPDCVFISFYRGNYNVRDSRGRIHSYTSHAPQPEPDVEVTSSAQSLEAADECFNEILNLSQDESI